MQGVSTSAPPCTKLVAVLHCRAPWCRSDCMEHHSRNITGKGVQAAVAGCTWVGLAALVLHAALQARAQPNKAGDTLLQAPPWSEPHTLAAADLFCILHTIAFPLFPILAEKTQVLFPPSLAVPLPGFSCPITAAEQSCPHSPTGLAEVCWAPEVQQQAQGWAGQHSLAERRRSGAVQQVTNTYCSEL